MSTMIREEINKWERDHFDQIIGWTIEYDSKPGYKIIIFSLSDKSKVKFELEYGK